MEKKLFSVLIANYNNGRYLQEAVDSVISQTYSNWELVIVDDKSDDLSCRIYENLSGDKRIHILYNDRNMGCGYTKRRCVENARGAICGFLDPDDVLLPNALNVMIEQHELHPEASIVFSRHYVCDKNLNVMRHSKLLEFPAGSSYFTNGVYSQGHFVSFKMDRYNLTEGISSYLPKAVDQDLYMKLDEVGSCISVDEFTYRFRICNTGISHENHGIPATFWNMVVRYETCRRRGLDPRDHVLPGFADYCMHWYREGALKSQKSLSYRLGHALLKPFKSIKGRRS